MDALYLLRNMEYASVDPIPKFNPESWLKERKLLWNGPFGKANGFGNFSEQMMNALTNHADVYAIDTWSKAHMYPDAYQPKSLEVFRKNLDRLDLFHVKVSLYHDLEPMPLDYTIAYTMFETTRLPRERPPLINMEKRCFVPCEHNVEVFKNSGVKVPIDVVPLGFNPEHFPYIDRPVKKDDEPFVFGIYGGLTRRKGVDEAIDAFLEEFRHDENVRLVMHNTKPVLHGWDKTQNDERIEYNLVNWSHEQLVKNFISKVDVGIFPTKGEGWGLPPMEMAATGVPIIVTNWSGPADYAGKRPDLFMLLEPELEPTYDFPPEWGYLGDWADIDVKQVRKHMRWAYENRKAAKDMGRKASQYLHQNFTWDHAAKILVDRLDQYAKEAQQ